MIVRCCSGSRRRRDTRPAIAPFAALLANLVAALLAASFGLASGARDSTHREAPNDGWVIHVEPRIGFAISLPASHDIAASDTTWYVVARAGGQQQVPDMTVTYIDGSTIEEVIVDRFAGSTAGEVHRSVAGTRTVRLESSYVDVNGVTRADYRFLAGGNSGVAILQRWEDFDWEPFDEVALSFRFVEVVPQTQ